MKGWETAGTHILDLLVTPLEFFRKDKKILLASVHVFPFRLGSGYPQTTQGTEEKEKEREKNSSTHRCCAG